MKKRTKSFDCIEHKRRVQRELLAEYEARKDEFKSYADFIFATADESPDIRAWRERMAGGGGGVKAVHPLACCGNTAGPTWTIQ